MSELEKFKRRLIRTVHRLLYQENVKPEQMWPALEKETGSDSKNLEQLWSRMRSLTIKKLSRLLQANDVHEQVPVAARLSSTDWLLFDLVLVHENIDVIGYSNDPNVMEGAPLMDLFLLVQRYNLEGKSGVVLADAWTAIAKFYNKDGVRIVSPMLLQRRWYQMKERARDRFYSFWFVFKGNQKLVDKAKEHHQPTRLQMAIAKRYPEVVTKPFLEWEDLIVERKVILPEEFEIITSAQAVKDTSHDKNPDMYIVEPLVETIDVDSDTEDKVEKQEIAVADLESCDNQENDIGGVTNINEKPNSEDENTPTSIHLQQVVIKKEPFVVDGLSNIKIVKSVHVEQENNLMTELIENKKDNVASSDAISEKITDMSQNVQNNEVFKDTNKDFTKTQDLLNVQITKVETLDAIVCNKNCVTEVPIQDPKELIVEEDSQYHKNIEIMDESSSDTDFFEDIIQIQSQNEINKYSVDDVKNKKVDQNMTINEPIKSNSLHNSLGNENNEDFDMQDVPDDLNIIDDGIDFYDEEMKNIQKNDSLISSYDETNFDLKLTMRPLVMTTKIEDMDGIDASNLSGINNIQLINKIYNASKLMYNHFTALENIKRNPTEETNHLIRDVINNTEIKTTSTDSYDANKNDVSVKQNPTEEINHIIRDDIMKTEIRITNTDSIDANINDVSGEDSDVSSDHNVCPNESMKLNLSSSLLQKPKIRDYSPLILCKNPDFNTRLKRLPVGFYSSSRNCVLLKSCMPVTIDLHKSFEKKLFEGKVLIENDLIGDCASQSFHNNIKEVSVSCIPSALPAQSLLDNSKESLQDLLPSRNDRNGDVSERNIIINLPDKEKIKSINQCLQTAEVLPIVQVENNEPKNILEIEKVEDLKLIENSIPSSCKKNKTHSSTNTKDLKVVNFKSTASDSTPLNPSNSKSQKQQISSWSQISNIKKPIFAKDSLLTFDSLVKIFNTSSLSSAINVPKKPQKKIKIDKTVEKYLNSLLEPIDGETVDGELVEGELETKKRKRNKSSKRKKNAINDNLNLVCPEILVSDDDTKVEKIISKEQEKYHDNIIDCDKSNVEKKDSDKKGTDNLQLIDININKNYISQEANEIYSKGEKNNDLETINEKLINHDETIQNSNLDTDQCNYHPEKSDDDLKANKNSLLSLEEDCKIMQKNDEKNCKKMDLVNDQIKNKYETSDIQKVDEIFEVEPEYGGKINIKQIIHKKEVHCCWASRKIHKLQYGKTILGVHNCPRKRCLCCCRDKLLNVFKESFKKRYAKNFGEEHTYYETMDHSKESVLALNNQSSYLLSNREYNDKVNQGEETLQTHGNLIKNQLKPRIIVRFGKNVANPVKIVNNKSNSECTCSCNRPNINTEKSTNQIVIDGRSFCPKHRGWLPAANPMYLGDNKLLLTDINIPNRNPTTMELPPNAHIIVLPDCQVTCGIDDVNYLSNDDLLVIPKIIHLVKTKLLSAKSALLNLSQSKNSNKIYDPTTLLINDIIDATSFKIKSRIDCVGAVCKEYEGISLSSFPNEGQITNNDESNTNEPIVSESYESLQTSSKACSSFLCPESQFSNDDKTIDEQNEIGQNDLLETVQENNQNNAEESKTGFSNDSKSLICPIELTSCNLKECTSSNLNSLKNNLSTDITPKDSFISLNVSSNSNALDNELNENMPRKNCDVSSERESQDMSSKNNATVDLTADISKKTILSDLMAMSGISEDDIVPSSVEGEQNSTITEAVVPIILDDHSVNSFLLNNPVYFCENPSNYKGYKKLSTVSTVSQLKYACQKQANFFKLNLITGIITLVNVSVKKKELPPLSSIPKTPVNTETIDLTSNEISDDDTIQELNSPKESSSSSNNIVSVESISSSSNAMPLKLFKSINFNSMATYQTLKRRPGSLLKYDCLNLGAPMVKKIKKTYVNSKIDNATKKNDSITDLANTLDSFDNQYKTIVSEDSSDDEPLSRIILRRKDFSSSSLASESGMKRRQEDYIMDIPNNLSVSNIDIVHKKNNDENIPSAVAFLSDGTDDYDIEDEHCILGA